MYLVPLVISFKTCSFERKGASLRGGGFALSRRAKPEPAEAERRGWDGRTRTYNIRVKVWCVTVTLHPTIDLGREAGIAGLPHFLGWEMGLEPTTPGTTIRCSYQLSYTHHLEPCLGTPGGTRTPGLLLRRQLLYPAELLALISQATGSRTRRSRPDAPASLVILPSQNPFVKHAPRSFRLRRIFFAVWAQVIDICRKWCYTQTRLWHMPETR